MLATERQSLTATLEAGCMPERRDLIDMMRAGTLSDFIVDLELKPNTPSQLETWRYLAKVMAIRAQEYIWRQDGVEPNPCPGPLNAACDCQWCEAVTAAEAATDCEHDYIDTMTFEQRHRPYV